MSSDNQTNQFFNIFVGLSVPVVNWLCIDSLWVVYRLSMGFNGGFENVANQFEPLQQPVGAAEVTPDEGAEDMEG